MVHHQAGHRRSPPFFLALQLYLPDGLPNASSISCEPFVDLIRLISENPRPALLSRKAKALACDDRRMP